MVLRQQRCTRGACWKAVECWTPLAVQAQLRGPRRIQLDRQFERPHRVHEHLGRVLSRIARFALVRAHIEDESVDLVCTGAARSVRAAGAVQAWLQAGRGSHRLRTAATPCCRERLRLREAQRLPRRASLPWRAGSTTERQQASLLCLHAGSRARRARIQSVAKRPASELSVFKHMACGLLLRADWIIWRSPCTLTTVTTCGSAAPQRMRHECRAAQPATMFQKWYRELTVPDSEAHLPIWHSGKAWSSAPQRNLINVSSQTS